MAGTSSLQERDESGNLIQLTITGNVSDSNTVERPIKIKLEEKNMILEWHFKDEVHTAEEIGIMWICNEREVSEPRNDGLYISATSAERLLKDANMVW